MKLDNYKTKTRNELSTTPTTTEHKKEMTTTKFKAKLNYNIITATNIFNATSKTNSEKSSKMWILIIVLILISITIVIGYKLNWCHWLGCCNSGILVYLSFYLICTDFNSAE